MPLRTVLGSVHISLVAHDGSQVVDAGRGGGVIAAEPGCANGEGVLRVLASGREVAKTMQDVAEIVDAGGRVRMLGEAVVKICTERSVWSRASSRCPITRSVRPRSRSANATSGCSGRRCRSGWPALLRGRIGVGKVAKIAEDMSKVRQRDSGTGMLRSRRGLVYHQRPGEDVPGLRIPSQSSQDGAEIRQCGG